jgi:ribonuclease III
MTSFASFFRRVKLRVLDPDSLEACIRYTFDDPALLQHALTHRSFTGQRDGSRYDSNERLEFLGDAVLNICVSSFLFRNYPRKKEGELTKIKSIIVSGRYLVGLAKNIDLGRHLRLSDSEDRTGGRKRPSILEDAYEALIGAIYLDGGMPAASTFIHQQMLDDLDLQQANRENRNYKSLLLELSQAHQLGTPIYEVVEEMGPDHSKFFVIEVQVTEEALGRGTGPSKKQAEQSAAQEGLKNLRQRLHVGSISAHSSEPDVEASSDKDQPTATSSEQTSDATPAPTKQGSTRATDLEKDKTH